MEIAWFLTGVVILVVLVKKMRSGSKVGSDGIIRCNGVEINTVTKTIALKGNVYKSEQLRGIRWTTGEGSMGNQGHVYIDLNDINYPTHRMHFISRKSLDEFVQRFSIVFNLG